MHSVVRVVATSVLISIGAASGAAAGGWDVNYQYSGAGYPYAGHGYGSGCGCGGSRGYFVQHAYETQPPVYLVNQGPTYTGPGISVPVLNYWSHGATRAYPYIENGYPRYHRYHHYSGGYSYPSQYQERSVYAPDYPRTMRPRIHRPHPYYRSRVLRVYGSADVKGARAQADRRDLPTK